LVRVQVSKDRYKVVMWKNKIPVYVCEVCGRNEDSEDEMILHVLKHEPEEKQEKILTKMLDEKEVKHKPIKIKKTKEGVNNDS